MPGVLCTRFSLGVLGDLLLQRLYYTRLYLVLTGFFYLFSLFLIAVKYMAEAI